MESDRFEIGKRIRDFRVRKGLTQAQFAEALDVSTNFISEIENGKKNISLETLKRVCTEYHLSADYILFNKDNFSDYMLIERLSTLTVQDIHTVIEYLQALLKMRMVEKRYPDS